MALTRRRLQELHADELRQLRLPAAHRRESFARWMTETKVVPGWLPVALAAAWALALALAVVLEPAPAHPSEPPPAWAEVWSGIMAMALTVTGVGLARRQRLGLLASVGAAGAALVGVVMCPVSGHHAGVGAWWYAQMAGFTALAAVSLRAIRRSRAS